LRRSATARQPLPARQRFVMHSIPAPATGWESPDFEKRVIDAMIRQAGEKSFRVFPEP